jgi:glycosyltransferase involved in cell wall biosynthesis
MNPTITLAIFAYRQEAFVEAALLAALSQEPPPAEIIVNDDASPDRTLVVIERVLAAHSGPVPVRIIRNPENLGLARSINNVLAQATGDVVVMAAGDDISLSDRCGKIARAYAQAPALQCVSSNAEVIDAPGTFVRLWYGKPPHERQVLSFLKPNEGLLGATAAFRRSLFDQFGPLDPDLAFEDRVIPLRAAMAGKVGYIDEPLVRYREHGSNVWMGQVRSATTSMRALESHLARENRMMRAVYQNRLRDLETGLHLFPERRGEIQTVQRATARLLRHAKLEEAMWAARGPGARLTTTLRAFAGGVWGRAAWRWIKLFYLPMLYYRGVERRSRPTMPLPLPD